MTCETKPGTKPGKPWQVRAAGSTSHFRSQRATYEAVRETIWDCPATVWHWEDGDWKLYERIEPDAEAG